MIACRALQVSLTGAPPRHPCDVGQNSCDCCGGISGPGEIQTVRGKLVTNFGAYGGSIIFFGKFGTGIEEKTLGCSCCARKTGLSLAARKAEYPPPLGPPARNKYPWLWCTALRVCVVPRASLSASRAPSPSARPRPTTARNTASCLSPFAVARRHMAS